jgi:hypothetical protein
MGGGISLSFARRWDPDPGGEPVNHRDICLSDPPRSRALPEPEIEPDLGQSLRGAKK